MTPRVVAKLEYLRKQFYSLVGRPFQHFFCPMLDVDEPTELCQAHVVNRAFASASPAWTIQRKDVDNFYGAMFESRFVNLRFREPGVAVKAMLDPALYRRLRPRVLLDDVEIPHFVATGPIPNEFAQLLIEGNEGSVRLGLKLPPSVDMREDSNWQFEVDHDFRVAAVVSVLKAAHLTAFELLDYSYALGPGGVWLGKRLGSFYLHNRGKSREQIHLGAVEYFRECAALVRPVVAAPPAITGTVDDRWIHFCWSDDSSDRRPWALLIYLKTEEMLHAALVPAFEHDVGAVRFSRFLESKGDSFDASIARFHDTHWTVDKDRRRVHWPPAEVD